MKTTPFRFVLPALVTLCAIAQEASPKPAAAPKPVAPIVSLSFSGGTLDDLVMQLRAIEPKVNIVVAAAAGSARVPAISVKGAGLDQVLDTACAVAESADRVQCSEQRGVGEPVFAIVTRPAPVQPGMPVPSGDQDTIVLSLNRLLDGIPAGDVPGMKVETILSAIEAANSFDKRSPVLRFHTDSGLLFLRGTRQQLALASDVLSSLERDMKDRIARGVPGGVKGGKTEADKNPR